MQQLKLLEDPPPAGVVPVWNVLDEPQRAEVVARLARVIAQTVVELANNPKEEEKHHE
jgi:hypothetical protein